MIPTLRQRYAGALLGLACGDAVGTTVEFKRRGSFAPLTDMVGGGPFGLKPGQWTDDTSMALCLARSLLDKRGFDAHDQMTRYVDWWRNGTLSSTGVCFDIGLTVQAALAHFAATGEAFAGSANPKTAGNGALMRLAPVVLYYYPDAADILHYATESSRTTHAAPEALDTVLLLAHVLTRALNGEARANVVDGSGLKLQSPSVQALARGAHLDKRASEIVGSGYAVASLEAAQWCFHRTDSFEAAVLAAANLGDDADTTAAIVGQIAGAHYGVDGIPMRWREKLHMGQEIERMADALFEHAQAAHDARDLP